MVDIQRRFEQFAATYPDLRLYRAICEGAAADEAVASLLTAASPGQARPVLFLAALHDLMLRMPDLPAARWYPSVTGEPVPDGHPWPDVRTTCLDHDEELRRVIASRTTQTNEVNRAVYLAPMLAAAGADVPQAPVALVEMGCSAGLLLGVDRFRVELASAERDGLLTFGDPASTVRCRGEQRGASPVGGGPPVQIVERVGLDLHPVALDDADGIGWLQACLWPDVVGRVDRFRAAVELIACDPPDLVAGDMVEDLESVARSARAVATAATSADPPGPTALAVHLVVFSSWALTYVAREQRAKVAAALASLGADGRSVSWLTAEPPGCAPDVEPPAELLQAVGGDTVLGLRRWRHGQELPSACLGLAHPHGEWLHWIAPRP